MFHGQKALFGCPNLVDLISNAALSFLEANVQRMLLKREERMANEVLIGSAGMYVGADWLAEGFFTGQLHSGCMKATLKNPVCVLRACKRIRRCA